ncbi:hypothetical protein ARMGADRAFT_1012696, partial [Armillaria gallica]
LDTFYFSLDIFYFFLDTFYFSLDIFYFFLDTCSVLHFVLSSFPPGVYPRLNATGSSP